MDRRPRAEAIRLLPPDWLRIEEQLQGLKSDLVWRYAGQFLPRLKRLTGQCPWIADLGADAAIESVVVDWCLYERMDPVLGSTPVAAYAETSVRDPELRRLLAATEHPVWGEQIVQSIGKGWAFFQDRRTGEVRTVRVPGDLGRHHAKGDVLLTLLHRWGPLWKMNPLVVVRRPAGGSIERGRGPRGRPERGRRRTGGRRQTAEPG